MVPQCISTSPPLLLNKVSWPTSISFLSLLCSVNDNLFPSMIKLSPRALWSVCFTAYGSLIFNLLHYYNPFLLKVPLPVSTGVGSVENRGDCFSWISFFLISIFLSALASLRALLKIVRLWGYSDDERVCVSFNFLCRRIV